MKVLFKRLSAYCGKTLVLKQPSALKRYFELFSEDEVIGSITFPKMFSFNADVKIFDTMWQIKNESIWKKKFGIYKYGYELPSSVYTGKLLGKGSVKLDKGVLLLFKFDIVKNSSVITTESDKILISARKKTALKTGITININTESQLLDNNPWLVMLLCYLEVARKAR
jgi:hypothetical protein